MAAKPNLDEAEAISQQRTELMKAKTLESDLDFAFNLQLEEAMIASLSLLPSSSSSSSTCHQIPVENHVPSVDFTDAQSKELEKAEQAFRDRELCEIEMRKSNLDYLRRIHDRKVAIELDDLSDDEWDECGDIFERPFGEGCSSSSTNVNFRLYFKGLMSRESVGDEEVTLTGIGVAICDPKDNLLFQLSKPLVGNGMGRQVTEIKALIEGLETAIALDLKRINVFCDYPAIFQYVRGVWKPRGRKVAMLVEKLKLLQKKFTYCRPSLVARYDMKFAFKLARDAIFSQISKSADSNLIKTLEVTCVICLEETYLDKMFTVDGCLHKYCFSCMKQHVEAKLYIGIIPKCPDDSCKSELNVVSSEKFLTPKLIDIMKQRVREASIPATERVYCPYPRCSALMSRSEVTDFTRKENVQDRMYAGASKCMKCHGHFCIVCKVPWHKHMTCTEYKRTYPYPRPDDAKLKSLAALNLWRQCVKCNHMIELSEGCNHMICRCGHQFCYTCGAEWKNKKATCSCPLWDEDNILFDDTDFDDDDEFDDEDDDYLSGSDSDGY